MIEIDGSDGEGGGQIIRTSLGLSLLTDQAVKLKNVRAKRSRPGLQRQHLMAVLAAAEVGQARVTGAELHSQELTFVPGRIVPGDYTFDIGTAGSTGLVLQTLLPPLMTAQGTSRIWIKGGTHNPLAPTAGFLQRAFAPALAKFGPRVSIEARPFGFYPVGGGQLCVTIEPREALNIVSLKQRGHVLQRSATAYVSHLPLHIAQREIDVIAQGLSWSKENAELNAVALKDTSGPGNAIEITIECEHASEVVTSIGERGRRAEEVARQAVDEAARYLDANVPIGEHLADQLLLPLALAGGGEFLTGPLAMHSLTNMQTIERFLPVRFETAERAAGQWMVSVHAR
jgi:RNA 3'-terminal phosphate cyclase (ATP)